MWFVTSRNAFSSPLPFQIQLQPPRKNWEDKKIKRHQSLSQVKNSQHTHKYKNSARTFLWDHSSLLSSTI